MPLAMMRATLLVTAALVLAAVAGEMYPTTEWRIGMPMVIGQYHVIMAGKLNFWKGRLALAACHPPAGALPSSATMTPNMKSEGCGSG